MKVSLKVETMEWTMGVMKAALTGKQRVVSLASTRADRMVDS